MQSSHVFWRMYKLKSKTAIIKIIKHDILSESKSVAWYQNYVHVKSCIATGYIHRVWRPVRVTFIHAPGKVYDSQAKAYCTISLQSSLQKTMEDWWPEISETEQRDMSPTSITICPQTREVHRNSNSSCDHTYTGNSGKYEVTFELS